MRDYGIDFCLIVSVSYVEKVGAKRLTAIDGIKRIQVLRDFGFNDRLLDRK